MIGVGEVFETDAERVECFEIARGDGCEDVVRVNRVFSAACGRGDLEERGEQIHETASEALRLHLPRRIGHRSCEGLRADDLERRDRIACVEPLKRVGGSGHEREACVRGAVRNQIVEECIYFLAGLRLLVHPVEEVHGGSGERALDRVGEALFPLVLAPVAALSEAPFRAAGVELTAQLGDDTPRGGDEERGSESGARCGGLCGGEAVNEERSGLLPCGFLRRAVWVRGIESVNVAERFDRQERCRVVAENAAVVALGFALSPGIFQGRRPRRVEDELDEVRECGDAIARCRGRARSCGVEARAVRHAHRFEVSDELLREGHEAEAWGQRLREDGLVAHGSVLRAPAGACARERRVTLDARLPLGPPVAVQRVEKINEKAVLAMVGEGSSEAAYLGNEVHFIERKERVDVANAHEVFRVLAMAQVHDASVAVAKRRGIAHGRRHRIEDVADERLGLVDLRVRLFGKP